MGRYRLRTLWVILSSIVSTICPAIALPQIPSAAINGRVTDATEAVVAGATLTVRHKGTGASRVAETQHQGRYQFDSLEPGEYEIEVRSSGFKRELHSLALRVGDHPTVNFHLELGQLNETVEVRGEVTGINTTDSRVDGSVGRSQIESLPLNGRNFLELARLEPGVNVVSVANAGAFGNNYQRVSIAGAPYLQTRVSVDGSTVDDRINGGTAQNFSQETVQEFQISSFGFDLSTGTTGTGAVNIITRQGGNDLHGSSFFYFRDDHMAAYPALGHDPRNLSPPFARRQSGFSLSGPLRTKRLFWFTNFEHNNQDGVFAVANNHPIFSKFDLVRSSSLNFNFFNVRLDASINNTHSGFLRVSLDKNRNIAPPNVGVFMPSNWTVSRSRAAQVQIGLTSVPTPAFVSDLRFSYGYLNNYLDPVTAAECETPSTCVGVGGPEIQIFDAPAFRIGQQASVPKTMLTRTYQLVNNLTWHRGSHRVRFGGEWEHLDLNSVHTFYQQPQIVLWGPNDLQRAPALASMFDALPATLKDPAAGLPTLSDILQLPLRSFMVGIGDPMLPGPYHHKQASRPDLLRLYVQDGWSVRRDLTLNYGLAYLYRTQIFNQDLDRPIYLAPLLGGDLRPPHRGTHSFEPKLGFAWRVGRDANTVIRIGSGLHHDELNFFVPFLERARIGPAGNGRVIVDGAVAGLSFLSTPTGFRGQDLLNVLPGIRSDITGKLGSGTDPSVTGIEVIKQGDRIFDPDHTVSDAIHVNAGIQRELSADTVVSVDYVMRRLVHLGGFHYLSQLDRNRFNRPRVTGINASTGVVSFVRDPVIPLCSAAQAAALNPQDQCSTGPINVYSSDANFRYQGLHARLEKRFAAGFQFTASYALARNTGWIEPNEYDNSASAYGNLRDHRKHRLTISAVYDLPQYRGSSRLLLGLLNNWTAALISQSDSAPPLDTMLAGLDLDGDGMSRTLLPGTSRHNTFGSGLRESELRELVARYNDGVEARTRRVQNTDGTTTVIRPRTPFNQIIEPIVLPAAFSNGDSFVTQDLRLMRKFIIGETGKLSLIGEVFNLLNISNLTGYNNVLNQANYGQPSVRAGQVFGSGGPRAFQFAIRLEF